MGVKGSACEATAFKFGARHCERLRGRIPLLPSDGSPLSQAPADIRTRDAVENLQLSIIKSSDVGRLACSSCRARSSAACFSSRSPAASCRSAALRRSAATCARGDAGV